MNAHEASAHSVMDVCIYRQRLPPPGHQCHIQGGDPVFEAGRSRLIDGPDRLSCSFTTILQKKSCILMTHRGPSFRDRQFTPVRKVTPTAVNAATSGVEEARKRCR